MATEGPLAASWHASTFLNPANDSESLAILRRNGLKIDNSTILARITRSPLVDQFQGDGYAPGGVERHGPASGIRPPPRSDRCRHLPVESRPRVPRSRRERPRGPMIIKISAGDCLLWLAEGGSLPARKSSTASRSVAAGEPPRCRSRPTIVRSSRHQ